MKNFKESEILSVSEEDKNHRSVNLFIGVILFYVLYMLLMQSDWVLHGGMWAEAGVDYYLTATNRSGWFNTFFSVDINGGYIPFLNRVVALIPAVLHFPAYTIPFVYTGSAILAAGAMVGAFCLPVFRCVIKSDFLRFFSCVLILMVVDFETRQFINFPYFVLFLVTIVTVLAAVKPLKPLPAWTWLIPFLMFSKPHTLVVLPAMMVIAIYYANKKFRWITLITLILSIGQIVQLIVSQLGIRYARVVDITLLDRVAGFLKCFFIFLSNYFIIFTNTLSENSRITVGIVIFCALLFLVCKLKSAIRYLIGISLSTVFFTVLLNCAVYNPDIYTLVEPLSRYTLPGYWGCVLIVVGISEILSEKISVNKTMATLCGVLLFLSWVLFSGWIFRGIEMSRTPISPTANNSYWLTLSNSLDKDPVTCVPVDPIGWVVGKNCKTIGLNFHYGETFNFVSPIKINNTYEINLVLPDDLKYKHLISFYILVKPNTQQDIFVNGMAELTSLTGETYNFYAVRMLPTTGGNLLFSGTYPTEGITGITHVKVSFSQPILIASNNIQNHPIVFWLGN